MEKVVSSLAGLTGDLHFGLGTSQIASLGRRLPMEKALKLFGTAFNNNVDIIDTADTYGSGDSEYLIGKILEKIDFNPFIITKAGFPYISSPSWVSPVNQIAKKIKQKLGFKKIFSSGYIINALNKSLKRLKKKQAGAFLLHELTEEDVNSADCWDTLAKVKKTGLAYFTGISSNELSVVREGIQSGQVGIVETRVQYGNETSAEIIDLCKNNKIPVIANEILGPFHSGAYNIDKIISEVRLLNGLEHINAVQLLIGVTYCSQKVNCILLGTRDEKHLLQNIASRNFFPAIEENLSHIKKIYSDNRKG